MELADLKYNVNEAVDNFVSELKQITKEQRTYEGLGIDPRALYSGWYNDECLVVLNRNRGTLDYYGGFEYVDKEFVDTIGDYTIYSQDGGRVDDVLNCLNSVVTEEEAEEA